MIIPAAKKQCFIRGYILTERIIVKIFAKNNFMQYSMTNETAQSPGLSLSILPKCKKKETFRQLPQVSENIKM